MRATYPLVGLAVAVSFLLGLVAAGSNSGDNSRPLSVRASRGVSVPALPSPLGAPLDAAPASAGPNVDFAAVAQRMNAAVVNVDTTARDSEDRSRLVFPRRWSDEVHEGSGAGFIIDAGGTILTNYHVIADAERVTVTLSDGRVFKASVVGIDPMIDVAMLQIPVREKLPTATLGRSEALRVGEWVCAIGNPLGYQHSVTVGVISFLGRKVFDPILDALIQTDAAITFGNSGGPLINARGQVVGITAAVSSQAANIGFAVPIDQVIAVLPQLRESGRVSRGDIGAAVTNLSSALRNALHLDPPRGALVQDVGIDTAAERAGLRPYDVIVRADDRPIQSDEQLIRYVASRPPGTMAKLEVWRDGSTRVLPVKLAERPLPLANRASGSGASRVAPIKRDDQILGLTVADLTPEVMRRRIFPDTLVGVVIAAIDPAGPSRMTPIREGQILVEVNRRRVASAAEYRAIAAAIRPGSPVALLVYDPITKQRLIHVIVTDPAS
jgi:serine protease Do